jgi:hypothetical protein
VPKGSHAFLKWNSHLELESLPTGGWGYDHFPLSAKYAATTGMDFLGMTGKFHGTWGEFGGFKRPNALRYECAAMLAFGSKCSVGDQLHPDGEMNRDTYELIGAAYSEVEEKESWCRNATPSAKWRWFHPKPYTPISRAVIAIRARPKKAPRACCWNCRCSSMSSIWSVTFLHYTPGDFAG